MWKLVLYVALYVLSIGLFRWLGGVASAAEAIQRWGHAAAERRRRTTRSAWPRGSRRRHEPAVALAWWPRECATWLEVLNLHKRGVIPAAIADKLNISDRRVNDILRAAW